MISRLILKFKHKSTLQPLQRYLHHTTNVPESSALDHPLGSHTPPQHAHATVALVSGGLESTALLSYWTHWSHATELIPLFVNYGQNNARKEQQAAEKVCQHLELPPPEILNLNSSSVAGLYSKMQRGEGRHHRASFRNLMLLTLGASAAAEMRASHVALAISKDPEPRAEDATVEFLRQAEYLLHALEPPISLLTPLIHITTLHVVQLGEQASDTPWDLSWSCLESGEKHCGRCEGCLIREEALASL